MWQSAYPLGQWAAKQGMKKGYIAVADYGPGHDIEAAFEKGFTEGGGATIKRYVTVSAAKSFDSVLTAASLNFGSFGSWTPPTSLSASVTMMVVVP